VCSCRGKEDIRNLLMFFMTFCHSPATKRNYSLGTNSPILIFRVNYGHNSLQGRIISKWDQNRAQGEFNDLLWRVQFGRVMAKPVKINGYLL